MKFVTCFAHSDDGNRTVVRLCVLTSGLQSVKITGDFTNFFRPILGKGLQLCLLDFL